MIYSKMRCAWIFILLLTLIVIVKSCDKELKYHFSKNDLHCLKKAMRRYVKKNSSKISRKCDEIKDNCRDDTCRIIAHKFICEKKGNIAGVKELLQTSLSAFQFMLPADISKVGLSFWNDVPQGLKNAYGPNKDTFSELNEYDETQDNEKDKHEEQGITDAQQLLNRSLSPTGSVSPDKFKRSAKRHSCHGVEFDVDQNVVSSTEAFKLYNDNNGYMTNQRYSQGNVKNYIITSTNICKVEPRQQTSRGGGVQQDSFPAQHSQAPSAPPQPNQLYDRSQLLGVSGSYVAAAAAVQHKRNPTGELPGPANDAATFLNRQLKSNQQDELAPVFSSTNVKMDSSGKVDAHND